MSIQTTNVSTPWPPSALVHDVNQFDASSRTLIDQFQFGSEQERADALANIYNRYAQKIWDYLRKECNGAEAEAKDIFGQVWLVAVEELDRFEHRDDTKSTDPLRSWLFQCAANRIKKYHREKRMNVSLDLVEGFLQAKMNGEDTGLYELFTPQVQNKATETLVAVTRKLKKEQKLNLWLRYNRSMTFAQIALELGKTENAVKVQHHRLLKKLHDLLIDEEPNLIASFTDVYSPG